MKSKLVESLNKVSRRLKGEFVENNLAKEKDFWFVNETMGA